MRAFKSYPENSGVADKFARHIILWTERGAARHAKMLSTEEAWAVFEKLEDAYFGVVKPTKRIGSVAGRDGMRLVDLDG